MWLARTDGISIPFQPRPDPPQLPTVLSPYQVRDTEGTEDKSPLQSCHPAKSDKQIGPWASQPCTLHREPKSSRKQPMSPASWILRYPLISPQDLLTAQWKAITIRMSSTMHRAGENICRQILFTSQRA